MANWDNVAIVHYSSESLNDANSGYSARITSIVVHRPSLDSTHSFAIHLSAEKHHIPKEQIAESYDRLEKDMLREYFDFIRRHPGLLWVHWNMDNVIYGFDCLRHRYQVQTGEVAPNFDDSKKQNLWSLVKATYGAKCVRHPHMKSLMEENGGIRRDFLSGAEEAQAFPSGEFAKLHKSTIAKVYWFADVIRLMKDRKLRVQNAGWLERVNRFTDHPLVKLAGVFFGVFGWIVGVIGMHASPKPDFSRPPASLQPSEAPVNTSVVVPVQE